MFCNRALWLDQGCLVADGPPADVTARYLQFLFGGQSTPADAPPTPASPAAESRPAADAPRTLTALDGRRDLVRWGSGELRVTGFALDNGAGGGALFELGGRLCIEFEVCAQQEVSSDTTGLAFALRNTKGLDIITYTTWEDGQFLAPWRPGERRRTRVVLENILAPGEYALVLAAEDIRGQTRHYYDFVENAAIVRVTAARPVFAVVQPRVRQSWVSGPAAASEAPA
jgi:lipopolysaccharide transport system ATP-binding protein